MNSNKVREITNKISSRKVEHGEKRWYYNFVVTLYKRRARLAMSGQAWSETLSSLDISSLVWPDL